MSFNSANSKLEKYSSKEIDYIDYLLNCPNKINIPQETDLLVLINELVEKLQQNKAMSCKIIHWQQLNIIEIFADSSTLKKLSPNNHFVFLAIRNGNFLHFSFQNTNWLKSLDKKKFSFSKFFKNTNHQIVYSELIELLRKNFSLKKKKVDLNNKYIQCLSDEFEMNFYELAACNEILLAAIPITQISDNTEKQNFDKLNKCFFISTKQQYIIDENLKIIQNSSITGIEIHNELLKNAIVWGNCKLGVDKKNRKLMEELAEMPLQSIDALRYILANNKENKAYPAELHQQLIHQTKNPYDELIFLLRSDKAEDNQEQIALLMKEILSSKAKRAYFSQWLSDWHLDYNEQFLIVQFFLELTDDAEALSELLNVHRNVRERYIQKNKNIFEIAFFDLGFCKHLIKANKTEEAKILLKENLQKLPDEKLWDLLPASNEVENTANGQFIRINYLDLLYSIEMPENQSGIKAQLHALQPLNADLAKERSRHSGKSARINQLLQGDLQSSETNLQTYETVLTDSLRKAIEHPLSRENKFFKHLQNWVAEKEKPDYSLIKKYAEHMTIEAYPQEIELIQAISEFYQLKNVEAFVIYGEKANEITAYEETKPFISIGSQFINSPSELLMSKNELAFALASELSNLVFKSTQITASDIWKGASKKGLFLVDTLLSIIPAAGFLGNSLKSFQLMDKFADLLNKVNKFGNIGQTGIDVLQNIERLKKQWSEENKSNSDILLSSRLLQINADRLGLLCSGDISASISAMLKMQQNCQTISDRIKTKGLLNLLNEKDNNNMPVHKDFAIRIASLFAFYLSDDFDILFKEIHKRPEDLSPVFFK